MNYLPGCTRNLFLAAQVQAMAGSPGWPDPTHPVKIRRRHSLDAGNTYTITAGPAASNTGRTSK